MGLWLAVGLALAFALTNGFLDAANTIATLVATRGATPVQALGLAGVGNLGGALLVGTAVASVIAGIVEVPADETVAVVGAAAFAAVVWNLGAWRLRLPSSSGHALVGGLVGAAVADAGVGAVHWTGHNGWRPAGVLAVLVALAVSPPLGFAVGLAAARGSRALFASATRRLNVGVRRAGWPMTVALSFSHGANDGQKSMGLIAAGLLATGRTESLSVPLWAKIGCGVALTIGTALGGWRVVRTVGRGIFRLTPLGSLASQTASTTVILAASYAGAPVSTTHVVSASVIGVGGGRRRWRHVRWAVVRSMGFVWLLTLPGTALLGGLSLLVWKAAT